MRPSVRENCLKMIDCGTSVLGWQIYASEADERLFYHTCKSKMCPSCGYRATLLWQRDLWTQLPDVPYTGVVLTMPKVVSSLFQQNRPLLQDLPILGGKVIQQWMEDMHKVTPFIMVVQHTFGRHLNFHCHLHIMISAGGLRQWDGRWIAPLYLNRNAIMKVWREALTAYLNRALQANLLKSEMPPSEMQTIFKTLSQCWWNVHIDRLTSRNHFLRYAARYIRRPPIAQHRFEEIDESVVKFWTKDTKLNKLVLDVLPMEDFVKTLAEHVLDRYQHAIRYFGLLAPRSRGRFFGVVFALLGQKRRPHPQRLSWAESIKRYFGINPLLDSRGQPMRRVGQYIPIAS